jgi:hypothetical protein
MARLLCPCPGQSRLKAVKCTLPESAVDERGLHPEDEAEKGNIFNRLNWRRADRKKLQYVCDILQVLRRIASGGCGRRYIQCRKVVPVVVRYPLRPAREAL